MVDDVQQAVGFQTTYAVAQARQIGGGVEKAAALFLHDKCGGFAFFVFKLVQEHDFRAVVFDRQTFLNQIIDHGLQIVVVFRFARHVFRAQFQAQRVVNSLGVRERNIDKLFPQRQNGFIAALQLHNVFARGVGKGRVFVKAHFGGAVKLLQIRQFERGVVFLLLDQIGDQHAELRTPVADVVLTDDGVAHKFQHARNAVADDAGTQMADVHLFC